MLAWDRHRTLRAVAIQSAEGQRLLAAIPEAERLESWHLALPSGELRSAGAAAAPLIAELPGGRPLAALFRAFPGTTERAYRFIARHRGWLAARLGIDAGFELRR